MRIIRKKMDQKKGKSLASSSKPKTPHLRKIQKHETKKARKQIFAPEEAILPSNFEATPSNIFAAVEAGHFEAVKRFVEIAGDPAVINSKGPLYLTALELAILLHNKQITKYLLQNGGTESDQCEVILERLKEEVRNNMNDDRGSNAEQTLWDRRRRGIRRVMLGWDQLKRPDKPKLFVEPIAQDSVMVEIVVRESSSIVTKLRVQWSSSPIFDVFNERIIAANPQNLKFIIPKLDPNVRYFFRAYAGNIKDWSSLSSFSLCCAGWKKSESFDMNRAQLNALHADFQALCDFECPKEEKNNKKKVGIHLLFNSTTTKFIRNMKRGIYLAFIFYNRDRNIFLIEDSVPCVEVCDSTTSLSSVDFTWLLKISRSWFNLRALRLRDRDSWELRKKLINAIRNVQSELGILDLGQLHHREIRDDDTLILTFMKSEEVSPSVLSGKWSSVEKIRKHHFLPPPTLEEMVKSHISTNSCLSRGLYLAFLSTKTSLNSIYVLTSRFSMLPHAKIRENPFVCGEEWEIIRENKIVNRSSYLTELQLKFLHDLQHAATDLQKKLHDRDLADLKFAEIVELNEHVTLLLVLPRTACPVVSDDTALRTGPYLPLKTFELLNISVYQPQMARKHFELSCTLELELHLAAQQGREAFSSEEIEASKQRLRQLQEIADACKELWRRLNWLNAVIAQDKKTVASDEATLKHVVEFKRTSSSEASPPKIKVRHHHKTSPKHIHNHSYTSMEGSSLLAKKVEELRANVQNVKLLEAPPPETSILQVFAAYDTGLPSGTSLKLRVTPKTTAREVIDLVVKQLNMAVVLKGKEGPIYDADELQNFCLVAIIGSRERSLRDDFRPLQLQNPWKKGTLYVRQKHDLHAAIEHSSHQTPI